ncbi:MAG TPA: hypothetical protein VJN18_27475 [Polyangiaceae bacterium]|nr:hypothetical protein [Polyangiaceae bacterium]
MRLRWIATFALCGALAGCRSREAPAPVASAAPAEVPVPATLLAELSVGNPKETWQRARLLGGDLAQALPSSLPVLLTTSLSMPPSAAGSLDETLPMVGALLAGKDKAQPDAVLGMHVTSGAELVASLTLGEAAKFRRVELAPGLVRLLPAPGAPEFNGALGVSGNYLLLATRVDALAEAGRFVSESVTRRARKEPGLALRTNEKVLSGSLSRTLRDAWASRRAALAARDRAQRQAMGRPPDFADPEVLLGGIDNIVESWLGVLESSRELSVNLLLLDDRLVLELTLLPGAEGAAPLLYKELSTGPLAPLLALPESTSLALLLRGDERPSADAAQNAGASLVKLFGDRLAPQQASKLLKAFEALNRSRRGATVVGLIGAPAPAVVATCELADAEAFPGAVADVLRLLELGPVSSWLGATIGKPTLELGRVAGIAHRARLRFQRSGQRVPAALPHELHLSWEARDGVGYLVVTPDAKLGLSSFAAEARLSSSGWMTQSQARLGERALGFFADTRLMRPGAAEPAPLLLTFGKQAERIVVSVDAAAPSALHALAAFLR